MTEMNKENRIKNPESAEAPELAPEETASQQAAEAEESEPAESAAPPDSPEAAEQPVKEEKKTYSGHLTPKLILELAAPHTWAASLMPVLIAVCLSVADTKVLSVGTAVLLLCISVLMQSAVNTINDYFDYVKGTDTVENQDDPTDAVLVYNDIDPKQARNLAIAFLAIAFVLGIPLIARAGWIPLVVALIGAVIVFLYSGGRTPISYLPIGELTSGFTMGGLIALASYQVLTMRFSWIVLAYSIPAIIGIALIMFTNNTCDIEKDIEAERKTLAVVLGRARSVTLYRTLMVIWLASIAVPVIARYPGGWYMLLFMVAGYGPINGIFRNPFTPASRSVGMSQITSCNVILGMVYALCLLLSGAGYVTL